MKILVTGAAGFIGYHVVERLLQEGHTVTGVDSLVPYYDVRLKQKRVALLKKYPRFTFSRISLTDYKRLEKLVQETKPAEIIHLAAQAGVRYSLTDPWAYADANYLGTLNVFEVARRTKRPRVVYASSSSVYGANTEQPFREDQRVDRPISLYAATKKANESLAHAYNHLFGIEMIGLRFFTVYGPWGRPDMALFKFVRAAISGDVIELYNQGKAKRSFTYIDDIVDGIVRLVKVKPQARYEMYNLGGTEAVELVRFVKIIEDRVGKTTRKKLLPLQPGDVEATVADCSKARKDFGYEPTVSIEEGIARFVDWFRAHETFLLSLERGKQ
ncbi:MAG: NAD-dependent epimerase/dehydratase family protein [Patescibacteria group bacterium]